MREMRSSLTELMVSEGHSDGGDRQQTEKRRVVANCHMRAGKEQGSQRSHL